MSASDEPTGTVLCLGLVGRERIRAGGSVWTGWGGAALYFASASAAAGVRPTVLAALTPADSLALDQDLERAMSRVNVLPTTTSTPCTFDLDYDDDLELARFAYDPGGAGHNSTTIAAIREALAHELIASGHRHLHICPLPPALMDAIAPVVLDASIPFSIQAHFSEIASSRRWLLRLMSRAAFIFMNRREADEIFNTRFDFDLRSRIEGAMFGSCFVTDRRGVTVLRNSRWTRFRAAPTTATDPTGAGDALAGGVVGSTVAGFDFVSAVNIGLAMASVAVSAASSTGILALSQAGTLTTTVPGDE